MSTCDVFIGVFPLDVLDVQHYIPEKPQIDNGQWTHLMSEIQVLNMFKLLKVVLLSSSAASLGHLLARARPAVDELYII